jgi:HSP20 family protein
MELVRWRPARDIFGFGGGLDRVFDDFFSPARYEAGASDTWNWQPVVDVYDKDESIVIKADLPGVDKKDIHVDLNGRVLTLSGERTEEKEANEDTCYRKERAYGKFVRTFNLATDVLPDKINATYKDGVLHVTIPKLEAPKPRQITIH